MTTVVAARAMLHELIDYAGLFPPAGLGMAETVRNYSAYRHGEHAWMLGRIVVPAARLCEFGEAARLLAPNGGLLPVSALAMSDADEREIETFGKLFGDVARVDAIETRAASTAQVAEVSRRFVREGRQVYVEIALDAQRGESLDAVREHGARAKVRTGGVKPEMCLEAEPLARFLVACAERRLAFKATAGLHHMRPAVRPLTYEAGAPCGAMHGFVNVFAAAVLLWSGAVRDGGQVAAMLGDPEVQVREERIRWREYSADAAAIERARREFAIAFGSCSFTEPLEELQQEGLV